MLIISIYDQDDKEKFFQSSVIPAQYVTLGYVIRSNFYTINKNDDYLELRLKLFNHNFKRIYQPYSKQKSNY